jgi:hypothetical protein
MAPDWYDSAEAVTQTNAAFQVTLPISATTTFYRLVR